ncbi:jg6218 [Pararge aegeria aegeria]|uniref:Jg6218 protein n=1 Tax=Pararge aegeria aegeria TaxID=348720 RepID=A0A8S4RM95_9NEOP|nr:jg6218 [Pararge aegeria aegeria]
MERRINELWQLWCAAIQYIPFYGGAKGQYLEVKKDTKGAVLSEKVVAEESISSENILKNTDENLLSKVLAANLQNLRSLSSNLLKIQNLGRKTGTLGNQERLRFKNQLFSLGEAASNTIKLIDEIGEDVDVLFKRNATLLRQYGGSDEEDVGEEGISIDSSDSGETYDHSLIAEANPVGLAVVGENGLAASRPMATAVVSSGVAIANPISTAIAGYDPTYLGINYNAHQQKSHKINGKSY